MARPLGVTILGVLVIIVAILVGLVALLLIAGGLVVAAAPGVGLLGSFLFISGVVFLIFAIILGLAGSGLLKLRPWAWWLATFVIFADLAWTGYGIYRAGAVDVGSVFTALVLLVLFFYMLSVRKYFRAGAYPA